MSVSAFSKYHKLILKYGELYISISINYKNYEWEFQCKEIEHDGFYNYCKALAINEKCSIKEDGTIKLNCAQYIYFLIAYRHSVLQETKSVTSSSDATVAPTDKDDELELLKVKNASLEEELELLKAKNANLDISYGNNIIENKDLKNKIKDLKDKIKDLEFKNHDLTVACATKSSTETTSSTAIHRRDKCSNCDKNKQTIVNLQDQLDDLENIVTSTSDKIIHYNNTYHGDSIDKGNSRNGELVTGDDEGENSDDESTFGYGETDDGDDEGENSDDESTFGYGETDDGEETADGGDSEEKPADGGDSEEKPADGGDSEEKPADGGDSEEKTADGGDSEEKPADGGDSEEKPADGDVEDNSGAGEKGLEMMMKLLQESEKKMEERFKKEVQKNNIVLIEGLQNIITEIQK